MFSMFSCRGSAALRAACGRSRPAVQRRLMSSGSGGSGTNIMYAVLCGGGLVGSVSYAYSIVSSDQTRYNQRLAEIRARPKTEWVPKPWPPKSQDEEEGGEEEEEVEPEAEVTGTEEEVVEEEVTEAEQEPETVQEEEPESTEVLLINQDVQAAETSGQSGTQLVTETDAEEIKAPDVKETVPQELPPAEEPLTPVVMEVVPVTEETAASIPVVEASIPVVEASIPVVEASIPVVEASIPVVEASIPVVEASIPVVEASIPVVEASIPVVEASIPESQREYIVVVLEGTPKEEKRPKVLGVGPMSGRLIPGPDDEDTSSSEGKRRLLKMQMQ